MTRPSRYPVASFGPELMAVLIRGAKERVEIPMKSHKEISWLQQRIHMLRGAMGREKHPNYTLVQRARTSRQWDDPEPPLRGKKPSAKATNFRLIIEPNDIQFADAIRAAGVTVDSSAMRDVLEDTDSTIPPDPSTQPTTEPPTEDDAYARFK